MMASYWVPTLKYHGTHTPTKLTYGPSRLFHRALSSPFTTGRTISRKFFQMSPRDPAGGGAMLRSHCAGREMLPIERTPTAAFPCPSAPIAGTVDPWPPPRTPHGEATPPVQPIVPAGLRPTPYSRTPCLSPPALPGIGLGSRPPTLDPNFM